MQLYMHMSAAATAAASQSHVTRTKTQATSQSTLMQRHRQVKNEAKIRSIRLWHAHQSTAGGR